MENEYPLVSTVITTYNREKTLGRAIESVLSQDYPCIELIVIDNGSTDGTKSVIQRYENAGNVKYIYWGERNRHTQILNDGILGAGGKYIAILDDDDFWSDKDKIKKQVDFLEKNKEYVLVGGGAIKIDQHGKEIAKYLLPENDADIRKNILISNPIVHVTVVYRKDIWEKAGGYDEGLDWGLYLKLGKLGKFYNFQEIFAKYTGHQRGNPSYIEKKYGKLAWLNLNIALKKKYKNDYPGYGKAVLFCWGRYFYSLLPFKDELWSLVFKLRKFFSGDSIYK